MTTKKGKYIRLTEQQLGAIVKEEVEKQLTLIMEYAIPRSKYVENVYNLSNQIIENWCLIHFSTLYGSCQENKNHWKNELITHMDNIWKSTIKNHKDAETRYKAILEGFDWNDLFESPNRIKVIIKLKFKKEGLSEYSKEIDKVCTDCFNNIKTIASIMANNKEYKIDEYVDSI